MTLYVELYVFTETCDRKNKKNTKQRQEKSLWQMNSTRQDNNTDVTASSSLVSKKPLKFRVEMLFRFLDTALVVPFSILCMLGFTNAEEVKDLCVK